MNLQQLKTYLEIIDELVNAHRGAHSIRFLKVEDAYTFEIWVGDTASKHKKVYALGVNDKIYSWQDVERYLRNYISSIAKVEK